MACTEITPITAFQSTNLNMRIDTYNRLGNRIMRSLGAPLVSVEIHHDQIFENIAIACEMWTKFAGYTTEFLVFDSDLYIDNVGLKLDHLFSITPTFNKTIPADRVVYATTTPVSAGTFSTSPTLSSVYPNGIYSNQILTSTDYLSVITFDASLSSKFTASSGNQDKMVNSFDYDLMDYRRVVDVTNFEEGSSDGVNTLFTIEQTLAQQTYFSYSMGNYGFDLISWYVMKDWMKNREKLLATKRSFTFDPRTQYLVMYPPPRTPGSGSHFYGVVYCHVERPLRDVIKEPWVYKYALALCKISVGNIRTKYQGTNLFGGGQINGTDMLSKGYEEKAELEQQLYTGASAGLGDADPPMFLIG